MNPELSSSVSHADGMECAGGYPLFSRGGSGVSQRREEKTEVLGVAVFQQWMFLLFICVLFGVLLFFFFPFWLVFGTM